MGEVLVMETEDWNESPWFTEWLEMARGKEGEKGGNPESGDSEPQRDNESKTCDPREFAPPFAEWNFSLRENAMMRIPRSVLALIPPSMAKAYLNAPPP
ncbi:MAG: hypothetical protein JWR69_654 [Pedosphaera sp.]|nr:hypothetical protein [Pedosphaera sp.]